MVPAEALLKKQGQQEVLKDIAAQAAELVALKKDHAVISTERAATDASEKRKAAEKMMKEARAEVSEEPQEESKEEKEKEEEVAVTQPKSLKDRVPWLAAGNMKSNLSRGKVDRKRRVGVTERPPEMENNEEEGGDIIPLHLLLMIIKMATQLHVTTLLPCLLIETIQQTAGDPPATLPLAVSTQHPAPRHVLKESS